jgi:hypothetical protein
MELDELKIAWQALEARVDAGLDRNLALLRELKLDKTRSALRWLRFPPLLALAQSVVAALLLDLFLATHLHEAGFVIPALLLQVVVLYSIVTGCRQLMTIARIDYSAPVIATQRTLGELRASRIRDMQRILLLSPLLWTPLVIVLAKGLLGIDLYRGYGATWLAWNLVFGLAVIPLAILIARRYAGRLRGSRFMQRLADDIAGRSLVTAMGFLDEIRQFEKE